MDGIKAVLKILEKKRASSERFSVSLPPVGIINICVPDQSVIDYAKRIFYVSKFVKHFSKKGCFEICILDDLEYLASAQNLLGGNGYRRIANLEVLVSLKFISIVKYGAQKTMIYNLGVNPKFGISSTLRRLLLEGYKKTFPRFIPFHAASMIKSLPDGRKDTVILSSYGSNDGVGKGKTTVLLANITEDKRNLSYVSNDDVLLSPAGNENGVDFLILPAEIVVRAGSLNKFVNNINFQWEQVDSNGSFLLSVYNLKQMGIKVTNTISNIKYWIFVDLGLEKKEQSIRHISRKQAERMFIDAIHTGRLNDLRLPLVFGEGNKHLDYNIHKDKKMTRKAELIFKRLMDGGTVFLTLTGGLDKSSMVFRELFL